MATAERLVPDVETLSAAEVLAFMAGRFGERLGVAVSFQKESSVITHMLARIAPEAHFFTLDTGFLFPETHETWRRFEERFGIEVAAYRPITPEQQAAEHGDALWETDPDRCCAIRKVTPLEQALVTVDAWVSGIRRDQAATRANARKLEWDAKHGLWKANPLADWTERDVWAYIAEHDLPYHPLHDRGYASIGCTHCTRPGDGRDGRWAGDGKVECGIHAR